MNERTFFTDNIVDIYEVISKLTKVIELSSYGPLQRDYIPAVIELIGTITTENENCFILTSTSLHSIIKRNSFDIWNVRELSYNDKVKLGLNEKMGLYLLYVPEETLKLLYQYALISESQYDKFVNDARNAIQLIADLMDNEVSTIKNLPKTINGNYTIKNSTVSVKNFIPDFARVDQTLKSFNSVSNSGGINPSSLESGISFETGKKLTSEESKINSLMFYSMLNEYETIFGFESIFINRLKEHIVYTNNTEEYKGDTTLPLLYNIFKLITIIIDKNANGIMIMRDDIGKLFGIKDYSSTANHIDPIVLQFILGKINYHFERHISIETMVVLGKDTDIDYKYKVTLSDDLLELLKIRSIITEEQYEVLCDEKEEMIKEDYIKDFIRGKVMIRNNKTKKSTKTNDKAVFLSLLDDEEVITAIKKSIGIDNLNQSDTRTARSRFTNNR